ncbi:hypothetical protein [Agromyces indicus]|uniref:hypothetical protein n=1 Tax=Agromyces indicus TaxID=758919 RepID=UPI00286E1B88|nr:hypothetical protein [Agromyces indicus]
MRFLQQGEARNRTLYDLQDRVRIQGWLVPASLMPDDLADLTVQRIGVRDRLTMDLASDLLDDLRDAPQYLERLTAPMPDAGRRSAFHR